MIANNILINYTSWAYDLTNRYMSALRGHKYHIIPTSPSPFLISLALLIFLLTLVFNLHGAKINIIYFSTFIDFFVELGHKEVFGKKVVNIFFNINDSIASKKLNNFNIYSNIHIFWFSPLLLTLGIFFMWSSNAIVEGSTTKINFLSIKKNSLDIAGKIVVEPLFHSNLVRKGFKIGFILFIISEVMFFFGFFWAFFHSSISPTIQIGAVWPPIDVEFITVKGFAIANTVILLTSGATLTIAHYAFELIPQKKNKLFNQNINFTESEESFDSRLNEVYTDINNNLYSTEKPEIYNLPFIKYLNKDEKVENLINKGYFSIVLPLKLLLSPFSSNFNRNFSLKDTEITIKLYINLMLDLTLILAILFMLFQGTEYFISPVNINTGVYGSTFYMITGLHGAHVFIGTCFLFYCRTAVAPARNLRGFFNYFYEIFNYFLNLSIEKEIKEEKSIINFEDEELTIDSVEHYGKFGIESFESAAWYWHFVDVVWIFVFGFVYVWSHLTVLEQQ